jgi:predicted anti-sigma-YlaC factor YlaD
MTCRELVEIVSDHLEGALAPADAARLEEHLHGCDGCTEYVAQMRTTIRLVVDAGQAGEQPDREALRRAFRRFRASR